MTHAYPRDLIEAQKLAEANTALRVALRKALSRLRDFERAAGTPLVEIAELELALGPDEVAR